MTNVVQPLVTEPNKYGQIYIWPQGVVSPGHAYIMVEPDAQIRVNLSNQFAWDADELRDWANAMLLACDLADKMEDEGPHWTQIEGEQNIFHDEGDN